MVNREIIERLLNTLAAYIQQLEDAEDINHEVFMGDIRAQRFVIHTLQIAVEATMDIAHHIISDEKLREPDSYADAFEVLADNGIISRDMKETGRLMAQFRNRIVHHYENISLDAVFTVFSQHVVDFERFRKEILKWLERNG